MFVYTACVLGTQKSFRLFQTRVTDSCEPLCGCWDLNVGSGGVANALELLSPSDFCLLLYTSNTFQFVSFSVGIRIALYHLNPLALTAL